MGVNLREFTIRHEIELSDLKGRKIAIDAYNFLFQFLASIRQQDGSPLMDSKGNVTSHLTGLFYRTINLLEAGILPVFVFDGSAPIEKASVQEAREKIREEARAKFAEALEKGAIDEARKFAQQTSRLTREMITESKELLTAMGIPWVQALAEGEAQAAFMANKGDVWAVASQDYDTLLFAAPRLIRNLTISGNKKAGIELIDLSETLNFLQMDVESLVKIALLIGTDYNPGGVEGVGPKNALKIIREKKFDEYKSKIVNYERIKNLFLKPLTSGDYELAWKEPNTQKIKEILVARHEFSEERIDSAIKRMTGRPENQKGLSDFF
ncbi:MAG: flap endonuclease-1 [Candidatus Nanoarchaeia archaeon]